MGEHPINQPIKRITVWNGTEGLVEVGAYEPEGFAVGHDGVTLIEACTKSGMHSDIPYVRVWRGDEAVAEFCQHAIVGVYFTPPVPKPTAAEIARWREKGIANIVNGTCTSCDLSAAECSCLPF